MILKKRPLFFFFLFAALPLLDCAELDALPSGTCGNGVVDTATEDCDTFPGSPSEGAPPRCHAPGTAAQCRLACGRLPAKRPDGGVDDTVTYDCPPGWGCGVDKVCRQPAGGAFQPALEAVSVGVSTMLVGDFDGDGRKDIFGSSALGTTAGKGRFHYFDEQGKLSQSVALPAVITSPFVRRFDDDTRDDLGFGYNLRVGAAIAGGIAVVLGQTDRAIVPKLFPSFTQPRFAGVVTPIDNTPSADRGFIATGRGFAKDLGRDIDGLRSADEDLQGRAKWSREIPGLADGLVAVPIAAPLYVDDPTSTCGELVVAYNRGAERHVAVFAPCTTGPANATRWANERAGEEISVPQDQGRIVGIHVATIANDDDKPDLLIGFESGVFVAHGTGKGFSAAKKEPGLPGAVPIASGDINKDGVVDYVIPGAVLLSQTVAGLDAGVDDAGDAGDGGAAPGAAAYYPLPAPSKRWTSAVLADVNRDGVLDVVGASKDEPDIDIVQGGIGASAFLAPSFSITTGGTVEHLVATDLDGDGTKDIAFVQRRAASDEGEIAIAYGRALTLPPEPGRVVGRAKNVVQIFTQFFSLGIATASPGATGTLPDYSLALMFGSGERQPFASLLFDDNGASRVHVGPRQRDWSPRSVAAGGFDKKEVTDFVALAEGTLRASLDTPASRPDAFGIWTARGLGKGEYKSLEEVIPLVELDRVVNGAPAGVDTSLFLQTRVGDVDGDGVEELIAVTPDATLPGPGEQTPQSVIRIFSLRQGDAKEKRIAVTGSTLTRSGRADLVDVDHDGKLDLVAIMLDAKKRLAVTVFYNDGTPGGGFRVPGKTLELPAPAGAGAAAGASASVNALGFAFVTTATYPRSAAPADVTRDLFVITPTRLYRVPKGDPSQAPIDVTSSVFTSPLVYGSDIVSGDFDGDGVDDLAVADSGGIRIIRQIARLP